MAKQDSSGHTSQQTIMLRRTAGQEIPCLSQNHKIHIRAHKIPSLDLTVSALESNPHRIPLISTLMFSSHLYPGASSGLKASRFRLAICIRHRHIRSTYPAQFIILDLTVLIPGKQY
jgi:hypothetical protein